MFNSKRVLLAALICLLPFSGALADNKLDLHPITGPTHLTLGDNLATLDLPAGYVFLNKDDSQVLLKKEGDPAQGIVGIILPKVKQGNYFEVVCRFEDMGFVKDDDAGKLNADELLQQFREGTKSQNDERKLIGVPPFYVGDWAEKPHYDKTNHQVIWALTVKDQDDASAPVACINYNTRILGRRGVLSMNLVTEPKTLDQNKVRVAALLKNTSFIKGQSYSDYQPGKDKDSGLGIAGLILGGGAVAAAAKMGVFAGLWKFILGIVLVLKKFVIVAILGVAAFVRKMLGKKKPPAQTPMGGTPDE